VTRKKGEEFEPTCIIDLFWEKAWGSINKESYIKHTIPIIDTFIQQFPELFLMQDHAPGHAAKLTLEEFEKRDITLIF
jgi:hypothetical protein